MSFFSRWFRFLSGSSEKARASPPTPPLRRRHSIHSVQHYRRGAFQQPRVPPYSLADLIIAEEEGLNVKWWDECPPCYGTFGR